MQFFRSGMIIMLFVLGGCVGAIDQSKPDASFAEAPVTDLLQFPGVFSVRAISDTRVEVLFPKALGGSNDYIYDVYVGTNQVTSFTSDILVEENGFYKIIVSGFNILKKVNIRVEARDAKLLARSDNKVTKSVTTFGTEVCQFDGIANVSNVPGPAGKDSIRVRWVPAKFLSLSHPANPKLYEIIAIKNGRNSQSGGDTYSKDRFDDPTVVDRKIDYINAIEGENEHIIRGLSADYKYHIRVRCLHQDSIDDPFNEELRSETNNLSLTGFTLNDDLASFNFQTDKISTTLMPGEEGYTSVKVSWEEAKGAFSDYRIYSWITDPPLAINPTCEANLTDTGSSCSKVSYSSTSATITGLKPNSDYKFKVVLCKTVTCQDGKVEAPPAIIKTTPSLVTNFSGATQGTLVYDLMMLGAVKLEFEKPDFTKGLFDEFVVKVRRGINDQHKTISEYNKARGDDLFLLPYNVFTDQSLLISGLNLGEADDYCFIINVKIGDNMDSNSNEVCIDVSGTTLSQLRGPLSDDFFGLLLVTSSDNLMTFFWTVPTAGFYDKYEIRMTDITSIDLFNLEALSPGDLAKVSVLELNAISYEEQLEDPAGEMNIRLPVDGTRTYKLAMTTSFTTVKGKLPTNANACVWICTPASPAPTNKNHSCEVQSQDCQTISTQ